MVKTGRPLGIKQKKYYYEVFKTENGKTEFIGKFNIHKEIRDKIGISVITPCGIDLGFGFDFVASKPKVTSGLIERGIGIHYDNKYKINKIFY